MHACMHPRLPPSLTHHPPSRRLLNEDPEAFWNALLPDMMDTDEGEDDGDDDEDDDDDDEDEDEEAAAIEAGCVAFGSRG